MNPPHNPWSIQLEVVEGCNYACWFCGIHNIRDPKNWDVYNYMDPKLVTHAFTELNAWLPKIRVEIDNHGEPALHPKLTELMRRIKEAMPTAQIQLQTNASTIEHENTFIKTVDEWYAAGMNLLCVNAYRRWWTPKSQGNRFRYFMDLADQYGKTHPEVRILDMYHRNPERISMYHYHGPKVKMLMVLDDLGEVNTQDRADSGRPVSKDICNEAGNTPAKPLEKLLGRPELRQPLVKKCTRPFRELILSWDGHIPVCCYDWSSQLVLGKFPKESLQTIWNAPVTNAIRELLLRKNRNMSPCDICDYNGGWRQGLLQPPGLTDTDEALQAQVAAHMRFHKRYTHPTSPIVIGVEEIRRGRTGRGEV